MKLKDMKLSLENKAPRNHLTRLGLTRSGAGSHNKSNKAKRRKEKQERYEYV